MHSRYPHFPRGTTTFRSIVCASSLWLVAGAAPGSAPAAPACADLAFCGIPPGASLRALEPALRPLPAQNGLERYVSFVTLSVVGSETVGEIWLARNECAGLAAETRLLADPTGAISYFDPAWSPDGRFLAYVETDASVTSSRILVQQFGMSDVLSEAATPIGPPIVVVPGAPSLHNRHPAWRSDGLDLAYDSDASGLSMDVYTIPLDETSNPVGPPVRRTLDDTKAEFSPAYSPDGQRLALLSNRLGTILVHLFTFATGAVQLLDPFASLVSNGAPAWSPDGRIVYYTAPDFLGVSRIWAFDLQTSTKQIVDTSVPRFTSAPDFGVDVSRHSGVSAERRVVHSLAFSSSRSCTGFICLYPLLNLWRGSVCTPTVVPFPATAFTLPQDRIIRLQSDRPFWNLQIEPADGSFELIDVSLPSVVLKWVGPGGPAEIPATPGRRNIVSDQDGDGIADIAVSFGKGDLRALFSGLDQRTEVSLECEGDLATGGRFQAPFTVDVITASEDEQAMVYPNPLNPEATLTAWLPAGPIRVRLFDAAGRLVRTLADDSRAEAGLHEWKIDGRDASGRSLGSGIYFFRIETVAGVRSGRFAILK